MFGYRLSVRQTNGDHYVANDTCKHGHDHSKEDHIPSDLVVDSCPHILRAAQPLISR